ncbi:PREDICTED: olfactory receptor 52K1-like [Nanorana parkeri]|uniref:olfactory receptor 52K1-like n=1 Tax=Nanorana parkeri TaxID=125878 RepID=UPI000854A292|nr:PREDICTED: olfactory receptor 52K1-like [Nanorana parkeri]
MSLINQTLELSHSELIMLSFPGVSNHRNLLFIPFLYIYLMILVCNCPIIYRICVEQSLHTPMYILILAILVVSVFYDTVIIPKMLVSFLGWDTILWTACLMQMFTVYSGLLTESIILLLMAYDRYVAICKPLHYHNIMNKHLLVLFSVVGFIRNCSVACLLVILDSQLHFCESNVILHFYCESPALYNLACGDISSIQNSGLLARTVLTVCDISIISLSYLKVLKAAMKIGVGSARRKALHTCSTHLSVVVLLYVLEIVATLLYQPGISVSYDAQNAASAVYFFLPAIVNPIIYGLRMKEVKAALLSQIKRTRFDNRLFKGEL